MKAAALEQDKDLWREDAIATIVGLAEHQLEFTADDLRREMREPGHPNWPGQAFAAARNRGLIEAVGDAPSASKTRKHGRFRTWTRHTDKGVTK